MIGAFVWLLVSIPIGFAMAPFQAGWRSGCCATPTCRRKLRAMFEQMSGGPAIGIGLVFGFFVMLVVSTLFGMLGGLFGALMFRKKRRRRRSTADSAGRFLTPARIVSP